MRNAILLGCLIVLGATGARGQLDVDLNVTVTRTVKDPDSNINTNFRGDDPFNPLRAKVFARYDFSSTLGVDAEVLFDNKAHKIFEPETAQPVRVDGLFLSVRRPFELPLNLWAGKVPTPVANFTHRSYAHTNPLIGFPLMHQHKLPLPGYDAFTPAQVIGFRDRFIHGVTSIYEACWITGVSAFGRVRTFHWMAAAGKGTLSNPEARENDGFQLAGRVAWSPGPWVEVGVSGALAPYLQHGDSLAAGTSREDVRHRLLGADLAAQWQNVGLHAEVLWNSWDTPRFREESVEASSWYVELKADLSLRTYVALRWDWLSFSDIEGPSGTLTPWGFDIVRQELGVGIEILPEWRVKAVVQRNRLDDPKDSTLESFALQSVFRLEGLPRSW